ncbi:spore gernimation protein GerD [Sporolactobacillus shoreae]|uniref:Spore gernimation protein GerD n=1 Tax=Sporolactobacillus shoreae TaxID=1465501 RepID=A0A4Z0GJI4_9BACL|nr:spore germination lipoprotein GerD [Sporolactobacillus shoreae]TGA96799.1 spore gernimation protein GerD [Sporolactobacillus shoreae]
MAKTTIAILVALLLTVQAGCGSNEAQPSYQENKKMVLDMLKTDDGKKTIRELLGDQELRGAVVFDEPAVKKTIVETLTTEQGKKLWDELIQDPDFSEKLAQTMEKENEQLLTKMMKDPGYQGMMMDILKTPDLQTQYLGLLRTKPFREQIMRDIQETMAGPFFKKQMTDAITETLKKQAESSK